MVSLNVATYNVRGLRDSNKRRRIFNHVNDIHSNIILMQETHSTGSIEKYWRAELGSQILFSHGKSDSRGCAIVLKNKEHKVHEIIRDTEGRYIIIKIGFAGIENTYAIASVYAPNDDNIDFMKRLFQDIDRIEADHLVIGGDFNTILLDNDSKGGKGHFNVKMRDALNHYKEQYAIEDVWRNRNPEKFRFTWARMKPEPVMRRLDYIFISFQLQQYASNCDINPSYLSDHSIPVVDMQIESTLARGIGRWMYNTDQLSHPEHREEINGIIDEILSQNELEVSLKWDMIKLLSRGASIRHGTRKTNATKMELQVLEKKLYELENQVSKSIQIFTEQSKHTQIALIRKDIEEIRSKKTQGAMIRASTKWLEYGEKMSKMFFKLEKQNSVRKAIHKLETRSGMIETTDEIMLELFDYYEKLFKENKVDEQSNFLEDIQFPQIMPEDSVMLDAPISLQEIEIAVNQLALDKTPGSDGYPINFIKHFFPKIKHLLHAVLIEAVNKKELPESFREGTISLMEKPGKNPLKVSQWRPLTMLNSDYKVYAKVLANRLQMVLPYLISSDQLGFMKGRNISTNIIDMLSVIEYCEQNQVKAIITAVDYEKAFDTVNWDAMVKVMQKFGFSQNFIQMVMMCFRNFRVKISNNGHQTEFIDIERGNKQGCQLSALQFLLIIEVVSLKLKSSKDIQPVKINGISKLLSQFADDLWTATMYNKNPLELNSKYSVCRTVKVTDTEPYYIRAVPATKAFFLC